MCQFIVKINHFQLGDILYVLILYRVTKCYVLMKESEYHKYQIYACKKKAKTYLTT